MSRKVWALSCIASALLGCGADDGGGGTSLTIKPGEAVDINGDGVIDGFAVDENGDGIADGVDTDNDGKADADLPTKDDGKGNNGGGNGVANNGAVVPDAGGGVGPDPENCQELVARAMPSTPDMLIVLDRSGSMRALGNDERVERWTPSVSAVNSITTQLDEKIRFGLMTFPTPCEGFLCSDACDPGELNVPVALNAGPAISTFLNATDPGGGTPTGETLEEAYTVLDPDKVSPDGVVTPKFVLLVTDGQPTCPAGDGQDVNQADITQSTVALDKLLAKNVKTYVIGYGTKNNAALAMVLDEFAVHGGTNDHRAVEDEATLVAEFTKIAGEIVSCSYNLDKAPPNPSFVLVELDGKQLNLDQPDGWSISGTAVTVQGQACATLQDGKDHTLSVKVKCESVPII